MKKILCLLLASFWAAALAACGSGTKDGSSAAADHVEGSVSELLSQVSNGAVNSEISLTTPEVTDENFSWYFFIDPIDGAQAAVSEPIIGSIPHFVGLLRVPEGTDPQHVQSDIEEKLDPRKWVCVEAEKTAVLRRDDLILLVMSDTSAVEKVTENFNAL